jgi:hypothetical protein
LNDNYSDKYFYGQLVTSAGTLSGSEFLISSQVANGKEAAVTFGKTNYLVVWSSQNVANEGNTNLTYGAFVSQTRVGSAVRFKSARRPAPDQSFLNAVQHLTEPIIWPHGCGIRIPKPSRV